MGQRRASAFDALDQQFGSAAGLLPGLQSGLDDPRVVEDQQIPAPQLRRQIRESEIPDALSDHEQAAAPTVLRRVAGDQLLREHVIEVGDQHGRG
jgi:hypothetical protein